MNREELEQQAREWIDAKYNGNTHITFGDMADFALEIANSRWVPTSERLPEKGRLVIVTYASGAIGADLIDSLSLKSPWASGMQSVAWMPLPEPYKKSE